MLCTECTEGKWQAEACKTIKARRKKQLESKGSEKVGGRRRARDQKRREKGR
jgi:hypothetical protein